MPAWWTTLFRLKTQSNKTYLHPCSSLGRTGSTTTEPFPQVHPQNLISKSILNLPKTSKTLTWPLGSSNLPPPKILSKTRLTAMSLSSDFEGQWPAQSPLSGQEEYQKFQSKVEQSLEAWTELLQTCMQWGLFSTKAPFLDHKIHWFKRIIQQPAKTSLLHEARNRVYGTGYPQRWQLE